MVCFREYLKITKFEFPKKIEVKKHLEDYLLPDNEEINKMYIKREDMILNQHTDTTYSNKPIRVGIVNKGGQGERI